MEYPNHLLPKTSYKLITWSHSLNECYLLRHTPDQNLIDDDTGMLRTDYIVPETSSSPLKDFSTNLLGTFLLEDRFWVINGPRKAYFFDLWVEGEAVTNPIYPTDFNEDRNKGAFFLRIGDIVDQTILYNKAETSGIPAVCRVKHTPTRSNFWHFSVRWSNDEGDICDQKGSWIDRMLKTQVKSFIKEHAILEIPSFSIIPKEFYLNESI